MSLYPKKFRKYAVKKLDTKCTELIEIFTKLKFYKQRTAWYLKPGYNVLCFVMELVIKKEIKNIKNPK